MKKFFSLLCATLLVFSASAAPVAKKAQLDKKAVAVEQMQKVQFEKAQSAKTLSLENAQLSDQLNAAPALTVSNQKAPVARRNSKSLKANLQQPSAQPAVHKAPAAVQEVIEVTDGELYQESDYIQIWSETQQLYFIYYLNDGAFELNTTYSLADMYMACAMTEDYDQDNATACSITITKPEGLLNIVASMTTESGKEYAITYAETPFVPTGVQINVNATNYKAEYISYYGEYVYTASNTDFDIALWVYTDTELGTFTDDVDIEGSYLQVAGGGAYVTFHSVVTPIVVAQDEDGNKSLTGSLYAENGDEYVFNLTYEKPDAKEISINVKDATLNNKSVAGFWTIGGQTEDKIYDCNIYFISKALQGTWTDVTKFDAYSTWVSDKSSGSNVYYENLSAVNLTSVVTEDSLVVEGTLSLADYNGNPAIVTVHISTPFTQEWGEWEDFAPFDFNTGKYTFSAAASGTQTNIPVQVRKDNTGLKQFKFAGWGKQIFTANGIDLIVDMAPDYTCTIAEHNTGAYQSAYSEYIMVSDLATYSGQDIPSAYDPETGTFELAMVYYISLGNFGYGYETMVMDKLITERDTVDVTADMKIAAEPAKGIIKVSAEYEGFSYILEVVGADTVGTFSLADGTLSQQYYYGIVALDGSVKSDFTEGSVTIAKNETGLKLNGLMIGADEKAYVLDWTYTPITERDTVKVNLEAITVQEDVNSTTQAHRGWLFVGIDTETRYIVQVLGTEQLGTFSYANGTLGSNYYNVIALDGSSRQQFTEGEVTIVEDEEGLKLTGLLIGEDEKAYALNWIQPAGRLQYDTDAPFDATFAWSDMSTSIEDGVIGIYATNAENLTIGLELYADPAATTIPAGTYVISDTQEAGTALQSLGVVGGFLTECWAGVRTATGISDCWFMVEGTITLSYDEYGKLKVEVDAKNSYGQPVTALVQYVKLEPKSTVTITDAEFSIYEGYMEEYGIVNFYGGTDEFEFDLYAFADTVFGNFTESIDFGDCGLYTATDELGVIDANLLEVTTEGKKMTLKAEVLGSDTILYVITATGYYGALPYDSNEDYAGEFAIEEVTFSQQKAKKLVTITGTNDDTFTIILQNAVLTDGVLAAGEYTDVQASTGVNEDYSVNPSYAMDAEGAAWFIQSGKLTVAEDGSMLFEGLNSYDKNVVITVTVPAPVTDYYLVGWINGAAYGIEGDIDNFGDYHFVAGEDGALKVKATFNEMSYVQVKDNNKQIYGTASYVAPAAGGASAVVSATGTEKMGIDGGAEFEYTLTIAEDGTMTLSYAPTATGLNNIKANVKAAKQIKNGQIVIVRDNKEYNILGAAL